MRERSLWQRWRRIFRRDTDPEIDEELRYHVDERVREYVASGMDPEAARSAALERLGDLGCVRRECAKLLAAERRTEKRRRLVSVSWLDVKLGVRMLVKYPGLSVVSVFGMAVAIAIGAGYFSFIGTMLNTTLPLDDGDRTVSIRNRDASRAGLSTHQTYPDYVRWRDELESVQDIGAFRGDTRNLITTDGSAELIDVAEMTASGFRLARVSPLLGRTLLEEDELVGATPVVVIGHEEWQRRFDGDPDILGQTVRLGETVHAIVGVMPEGFGFPINHRYWVPLRQDVLDDWPGAGSSVHVFGRLAGGFTMAQARAEAATIGRRMALAFPEAYEHLRPQVLPYSHAFVGIDSPEMGLALRGIQLLVSLLLVIVAVNVAILVYARTATRLGEIAVRSALGASRRRIVAQLFVEALVLTLAASAIGLTVTRIAFGILSDFQSRPSDYQMPFWIEFGLSPGVIVYVALLAVLAGAIVGVLPALKATGHRLQPGLQQFSAPGSAMELGRTWTVLIVVQVAIAVAALPAAVNLAEQSLRLGTRDPAAVAHDLVRTTLVMTDVATRARRDSATSEEVLRARFTDRATALVRRLEAEPGVSDVTFAQYFPGTERAGGTIEFETGAASPEDAIGEQGSPFSYARTNHIGIDLFDVFDVPLLAGRGFVAADAGEGATAVIVNETLARRIAGDGSALGRRLRYARRSDDDDTEASPWFEIVGVVRDFADAFTTPNSFDGVARRLYHAAALGKAHPVALVVRTRGDPPARFAARLRGIAATVDPTLRLERLEGAADAWNHAQQATLWMGVGIAAVMLSVLLLSAAGIYAMMSFTVARRRREIGIRAALGANSRRLLAGIFARSGAQLGIGALAGLAVAVSVEWIGPGGTMGDNAVILLAAVATLMLGVGLLATLGPARRGLAVQPTEALREG